MRMRRLAIELHRLAIELRRLAIELRRLAIELRRLAIELRRLTIELRRFAMGFRGIAIAKVVRKSRLRRDKSRLYKWSICPILFSNFYQYNYSDRHLKTINLSTVNITKNKINFHNQYLQNRNYPHCK
ncbi:hypothetical protein A6S26_00760 [Nostoc sp. ATCC 43529]|nr:hypothetical protein A6S26_00760 [Nostoc sp. ATCC 43529]